MEERAETVSGWSEEKSRSPGGPAGTALLATGDNLSHYLVAEELVNDAWQRDGGWTIGWRDVGLKDRSFARGPEMSDQLMKQLSALGVNEQDAGRARPASRR